MNIVAIEGIRGCGKSTLLDQLGEKHDAPIIKFLKYKFPTDAVVDIIKNTKFNMDDIDDVIRYNLIFVADFMHLYRNLGKKPSQYRDRTFIIDRYILSNLAHFKYDMYKLNGGPALWDGISAMLYAMYNSFFVEKPKLIIYLKTNKYMQPDTKFDDGLYGGAEHELEWFYNTELGNLHNKLDIPFYTIEALKPGTFQHVESLLKKMGYL